MLNKISVGLIAVLLVILVIPIAQAVDQNVSITATVDQVLTFNLGGVTDVYFGILGAGGTKYASSTSMDGSTEYYPAHLMNVATNGTGGYSVAVSGNTLTSGVDTISPLIASSTPTPGTEQFGLNVGWTTGSGEATISYGTFGYYMFNSGDTIIENAGVTGNDQYVLTYIANIAPLTEAGSYTTTITYTTTGHF
ncbi:MAG: hypothetical protein UT05_C0008G0003 [Parcubacteria group bacterium GW2011_GWF2_38_76]|nr:MAG: hypothetical protein UT05_C0008G0003 [Parcubacteria group bacterium GW2011_GWF2_38_76]HBM45741.1 hypothetical protein [Patescibacteria group bacterium]